MRDSKRISLLALAAGAAGQLLMPWTTDFALSSANAKIGPDGPWQAVVISINGNRMPLWPGGSSSTELLTEEVNGTYTPGASAKKSGNFRSNADSWLSHFFIGGGFRGQEYYDEMELPTKFGTPGDFRVNATIIADNAWRSIPNGTTPAPTIGLLGLGPKTSRSNDKSAGSILEQLRAAGKIERSTWGLHIGSAALDIPGSLVLGGYEQNRALGEVGTFTLQEGVPRVFLRDVIMGTEIGASSSFPASVNRSFWVEPTGVGMENSKILGGPAGSAVVLPNPVSPYIYLQRGVCEAIAENLGLTLHKDTGLYLWQSGRNGSVSEFINSPSYLAFVLSDNTAANLTVKVPFKLLNLTLEPPLVEEKVSYFPCKSVDGSSGQWQLGRAFLQAAFLGVDYDKNVMYIAQAPGPGVEQSVVQKFDDSVLKTNPIESFQATWSKTWTVTALEEESQPKTEDGLSPIGIVGIVFGVIVGIIFILWYIRHIKKLKQAPGAPPDHVDKAIAWFAKKMGRHKEDPALSETCSINGLEVGSPRKGDLSRNSSWMTELDAGHLPAEMGGSGVKAKELDSTAVPAEIETPLPRYPDAAAQPFTREAPNSYMVYELPAHTYTKYEDRLKDG
ncbi:aspartic-type endopeptidase [Colletotrichum truncatum]|uniref:Aspartic-type endopeptidase n=1 Tax=Colletotrichum truncatum TaxID=5467 RepID=A0ACC3YVL4_COLTU|nr:aspartic-type endopeptidase [Colletotrichum truncatum]KAF6781575.1 aspartic-type endopeptidase [Colletotrichum truncatum]